MPGVSYAGTYQLKDCGNGWQAFLLRGTLVGYWKGSGGVYAAANYFVRR